MTSQAPKTSRGWASWCLILVLVLHKLSVHSQYIHTTNKTSHQTRPTAAGKTSNHMIFAYHRQQLATVLIIVNLV